MYPSLKGKSLVFWDDNDHHNEVIIDEIPDTCPRCDRGIKPIFVTSYGFKNERDYRSQFTIQTIFRCPRTECQVLFVTIYEGVEQAGSRGTSEYVFKRATGYLFRDQVGEKFGEEIEKLSIRFIKIYNQAKTAEEGGLDEMIGPGYRKALEILIKDYLIFIKPTIKEAVLNNSLGFVIVNYINNEKIKIMAGLAKNVGNNETHYQKKLEGLTIDDLKKLIKLTSHWIVTELLTKQYSELYKKLMHPKKDSI